MRPDADAVLGQIVSAGLLKHLRIVNHHDHALTGTMSLLAIVALRKDTRFTEGPLHRKHADVGNNRTEFRSYRGTVGAGSLQIVVDKTTGRFYADIDVWNPYADAVNWVGHTFGEVLPGWFRKRKDTGDHA